MKDIVITEEEMHFGGGFSFSERMYTPHEKKMELATYRADLYFGDNLLWHGYEHEYLPQKKEWHFTRPTPPVGE